MKHRCYTGKLGRWINESDWPALAAWIEQRFGVAMRESWVAEQADDANAIIRDDYLDHSWQSWWKRRLERAGVLPTPRHEIPEEIRFFAVLHVFFIGIPETQEMLAILGNERLPNAEAKHATPKITRSNLATIEPINRTAANVVKQK